MATVTKRDLVLKVSKKHDVSQQLAGDVIHTFITTLCETLAEGNEVSLRKFGNFCLAVAKAKKGRNPNVPGVDIHIPERVVLKFRPSEELKAAIEQLPVKELR